MGVFSRFSDIVNSNINSLLDRAEDPEKMVRLIIQEMEDTLVEVRSNSARVIAEKKDLVRRIERLKGEADDWQARAELALSKDREDLAKGALLEKQKVTDAVSAVEADLAQHEEQLTRLKDEIGQLQDKLKDAKARQQSILLRRETISSRLEVKKQLDSGKVQDAMVRFEQYERKIDNLEAEVESYDLGTQAERSLAQQFEDLEAEDTVTNELEALKKKLKADKKSASKA
ncbi:phage shock protein PspA [Corallincola spongiicola]|uniref:Phage shock protein PspA n=1 Tax=Corallincola spongiicola TaxID=2520508 RepID=A0ABY1WMC7_9GAMM|nr:phage shock protein PspA [Corallincola spongiicola]TAA42739.1 phage shock protein PspA [Corallincola spongiicola]